MKEKTIGNYLKSNVEDAWELDETNKTISLIIEIAFKV